MAFQEDLRRIHSPAIFGNHFNERPKPDALRRSPTTPLAILRVMRGEFNAEQPSANSQERVVPDYERLKKEREQRRDQAKKARIRGKNQNRYYYGKP